MKVAMVGSFDYYGHMGCWVADAWEANGHEVERIDRRKIPVSRLKDKGIVLYVDCSESINPIWEMSLKGDPIKVFWSLDQHMPDGLERSVNIARKCDLVFCSNYEHGVKKLEKFGIDSYLLPITYSDSLIKRQGIKPPARNEVVMIGNPNCPERKELWKILHKNFETYSGVADTEWKYYREMSGARIVVNQPTEPWDMILNNRFFEALGFEKLLLQKRLKTNLIEKLGFVEGKDFIYWDDFDDLVEKIEFWLANPAKREMMRSGKNKVQKYSMSAQCAKMENIILSKFYDRL